MSAFAKNLSIFFIGISVFITTPSFAQNKKLVMTCSCLCGNGTTIVDVQVNATTTSCDFLKDVKCKTSDGAPTETITHCSDPHLDTPLTRLLGQLPSAPGGQVFNPQ